MRFTAAHSGFSAMRFTDDRAPVEMIVNSMVIEFLMGGGLNELD